MISNIGIFINRIVVGLVFVHDGVFGVVNVLEARVVVAVTVGRKVVLVSCTSIAVSIHSFIYAYTQMHFIVAIRE